MTSNAIEECKLNDKNFCQCGCKEEIPFFTKHGKPQKFKHGHNVWITGEKTMFKKGNTIGAEYRFKKGHIIGIENRFKKGDKKLGEDHPGWKGGRYPNSYGYILIYRPNHPHCDCKGYVFEHRLVYEEYHNCCLLPWIDIHHINEIRSDNRIENLIPLTRSKHISLHKKNLG